MDTEGDPGFHYHVAMAQVWGLIALRLAGEGNAKAGAAVSPLPFNFSLQAEAVAEYIADAKGRTNGTQVSYTALDAAQRAFAAAAKQVEAEASALAFPAVATFDAHAKQK